MILTDEEIQAAYEEASNQHLRQQDKRMVLAVSRAVEAAITKKIAEFVAESSRRGAQIDAAMLASKAEKI